MKNLNYLWIFTFLTFFLCNSVLAQSTYTWIGADNALWTTSTNWSPTRTIPATNDILQFTDGTTKNVTSVPSETIGKLLVNTSTNITLQSNGTITLTVGNVTGDDIVIASGSSLTIGGSFALTVTLAASATADISGTLTVNSGRTYNTNGTSVVTTVTGSIANSGTVNTGFFGGAKLVFSDGSTYQHSQNGGTVPASTWNANSTCFVTGVTSTGPSLGIGQSFANFSWNCPGQTIPATLGMIIPISVNGNFTLSNTGSGSIQFPALIPATITGNYSQTGGSLLLAATNAQTLNVGGDFSISGGTFLMSGAAVIGTLNVTGNFSHTGGNIDETSTGSGLIVFNGSGNQSYTGGGTISNTIDFNVNNPAGLILLTSVTFPATLTMTTGNITTGANTLTLGTSTSNLGILSYTSGTIRGNFRRWFAAGTISNVLFPIGTSTNYRSANISFTSAPSAGGTLTAFFTASNPGTTGLPLDDGGTSIVNVGIDGYWTITSGDGLTGGTYNLDLTADGFSGVSVVSTLRLLKRSTPGGNWTLDGTHSAGTGTTGTPVVHRTGMTGFSEFGVGGASDNPLPVELTGFSAVIKESAVLLNWKTETEVNNYGFEIQRSVTTDKWDVLGFVEGHGNSNSLKEYSFTDTDVNSSGIYYYRLKQIDNDGAYEFSNQIEVNFEGPNSMELNQNYPNPFNPSTTISFNLPKSGEVTLKVYNLMGEEIKTLAEGYREAGIHSFSFNAEGYPSGMYLYSLSTNGYTKTKKMLLMK